MGSIGQLSVAERGPRKKTHPKRNDFSIVKFDDYKIVRNNGQSMVVDAKVLHRLGTGIDQSESVGLA